MKRAVVAAASFVAACDLLSVCFQTIRLPQPIASPNSINIVEESIAAGDRGVFDERTPLELLRTPLKLEFDGVSLSDALAQVGAQLKVPVELDAPALGVAGLSTTQPIALSPAERTAHEWFRRIQLQAGPDGNLRTAIDVDANRRIRLLVTTAEEVERRYLLAVPSRPPSGDWRFPASPVADPLDKRITVVWDRNDLNKAFELVAEKIGIPVLIDRHAFQSVGITVHQSFGIRLENRPAREVLEEMVRKVSPDGKLRLTLRGPLENPTAVFVTTKAGNAHSFWMPSPAGSTSNSPSLAQQWTEDSQRPPIELRTAADAVVYLAGRLEAVPYLDLLSTFREHRIELSRRIRFPRDYRPAEEALVDVLGQVDGELSYFLSTDELGRRALVIATRGTIASLGRPPTYAALQKKNLFGGLELLTVRDLNRQAFTRALGEPVAGAAEELPLRTALERTAAAVGVRLDVLDGDLLQAEISPNAPVRFDPQGREARSVLWDLLRQADPLKNHRVIYCYQMRDDGRMQLSVTTRDAAEAARRSIPMDFRIVGENDE